MVCIKFWSKLKPVRKLRRLTRRELSLPGFSKVLVSAARAKVPSSVKHTVVALIIKTSGRQSIKQRGIPCTSTHFSQVAWVPKLSGSSPVNSVEQNIVRLTQFASLARRKCTCNPPDISESSTQKGNRRSDDRLARFCGCLETFLSIGSYYGLAERHLLTQDGENIVLLGQRFRLISCHPHSVE